jgi:ABC-type sulfate transport system permease component
VNFELQEHQVVGTSSNKSVELNNLVASCQQAVDNLSTSWEQAGEHILITSCWNSIATSLHVDLLQIVRFTFIAFPVP